MHDIADALPVLLVTRLTTHVTVKGAGRVAGGAADISLSHGRHLILGTDAWIVMNCIKTATYFFIAHVVLPTTVRACSSVHPTAVRLVPRPAVFPVIKVNINRPKISPCMAENPVCRK